MLNETIKTLFTKNKILVALSTLAVFIIAISFFIIEFFWQISTSELNFVHRLVVKGIVNKFELRINKLPLDSRAIINYDSLFATLNFYEKNLITRIFDIDPISIGFKGKFISRESAFSLKQITSVKLPGKDNIFETGINYLPPFVYQDYQKMMNAMFADIGKRLYVNSGYRSVGRQAYVFLKSLIYDNNFSLSENGKWIAMPGYSEHGDPNYSAIDFVNSKGVNGFSEGQTAQDFEKLEEYLWLLNNAEKFNFSISYPKENNLGVSFEPWHWHWTGIPKETVHSFDQSK